MTTKFLGVGYLLYQFFTKGVSSLGDFFVHGRDSELYHTLHEHHWDSILDFSGGATLVCLSIFKFAGIDFDLDTQIGTFAYYSLLSVTILWMSFRFINAVIDFVNKCITTYNNWNDAKFKREELRQKEFANKITSEMMDVYNKWEKERDANK